jgi:PAS domain S-box-containing protein
MKPAKSPRASTPKAEIAALVATMTEAERRLEELTGGEVDTVMSLSGSPFVLRRAQAELRQSESDRQASILNSLPAHVALLDARGVIVTVNETWRQFAFANHFLGSGCGVGVNYLTVCDEARGGNALEAPAVAQGIRAVLDGARSFSLEYPCHSPTAQRWFQLTASPLSQARSSGVVIMHVNVTGRKLAEQAMRDSQTTMAAAQQIGHFGSWEVDLNQENDEDRNLLRWSDEMFHIAGYEPGAVEITNRFFFTLIPVEEHALIREAIAGAIRERKTYTLVHRLIRADGSVRFLQEQAKIFFDETSGRPVKIIGTAHDITERMQADTALRASEQRFKALFDQAAVGVAQVDVQTGRYLQVNRRFCDIVGRSPEEMARINFAEITHPQDMAQSQEMTRRMRAGLIREYTQEKRYVQAGRPDVWASVTVSVMWAPGETPDFFIAVVQDITQRKQMEEQVRQAQKMDAIGTLAGGIAHDFNNILAAIGGYTELARMTLKDNPGPRAHLGSVLQAVKRAADLVRQILTFSRQQPIERRAVELGPLVQETFGLLRATIPTTIEFELSVATDAPTVLADVTQVHQILMNLGTNAWHAMKNRPGRLAVRLERLEVDKTLAATQPRLHPGLYARVSVSDTGTGMDPLTLSRIFDPFFTTKAPGEGTGLGLAVAQGIMDTHDGVITVESTLAVGTVFHVYFPAHLGQVAPTPVEISAIPRGRGERILVVDDEELLAQMMQQALITLGYAAEFATNPVAALDLVRADAPRFTLVLTDLTMPGMTGLSLAARLRQIRPDLPIILMTGYSATLTPARVKAEGLQDLLLKPTSLPSLASAVHAALVPQPPV